MRGIDYFKMLGITLTFLLIVNSCKKDEPASNDLNIPQPNTLDFEITHTVDGEKLDLDVIKYTNASNNTFSVITLRYFISNIYLHKGNDSLLLKDYHYVDIYTSSTHFFSAKQPIFTGSYDYISLIIGLNEFQNINGFFVNPPEVNMAWPNPMGGGFHYMQLEGKYDSAGTVKNYNFHTGKLMNTHRYIYIKLPASSFEASGADTQIDLEMNINEWLKNPNNYDFNTYGEAIMGNASAQTIIQQNGKDVFSVKAIK